MQRISTLLALLFLPAAFAQAHDTGFGHSRRTLMVSANANAIAIEYRIAVSADEALIEATQIDTDGDGQLTPTELDAHFAGAAKRLIAGLTLRTSDGQSVQPTFVRYRLENSLTQTFCFSAETSSTLIALEDRNFAHKPGQVRILKGQGVKALKQAGGDLSHVDRLSLVIQREKAGR